ncbi:MAG: FAD binding domain-containing protein [Chloroflexi bacterium]|nr:FAD binding domain-containing protein [Chloroflexota bacterium]
MKAFDYASPSSLDEAQGMLSQWGADAMVLAGGTDLVVAMKKGIHNPKLLVSVRNMSELKDLRFDPRDGLSVGAAVTLSRLAGSDAVKDNFPILAQAAASVASYQIRHRATIGGNVALDSRCWYYNQSKFWKKSYPDCRKIDGDTCYIVKGGTRCYALFSADTVPALLALDARVRIAGPEGLVLMQLSDLYTGTGDPANTLRADQIIAEVFLPRIPERRAYYRKYQNRPSIDFATVTIAAAAVKGAGGLPEDIRIVLGGVDSGPVRARQAEHLWQAAARQGAVDPTEVAAVAARETRVFNTFNGSAIYKKRIVQDLVEQAVRHISAGVVRATPV